MGTYGAFGTDESLEKKGIEIDYGDAGTFLVARAGGANKKFQKMVEQKFRPYRRQVQAGTMDNDVADRLLAEVFASTVLIDWDGVTDEQGEEMACTAENAVKLFTDLPDLFSDLREQAQEASNFQALEVENDLGN